MEHHEHTARAFLSVISWPEGVSGRDAVQLLRDCFPPRPTPGSFSFEDMRLRAALPTPMILGHVPRADAHSVVAALRDQGGDAFAPTASDLVALGPTLKIRDLRLVDGDLDVTLWRGPEARIKRASILSLVRAHLSDTVIVRTPSRAHIAQIHFASRMPPGVRREFIQDSVTRKTQTSDKLDIHTIDGSVFQLDGDKFGYQVLGDMKGHSDKVNMDRMFELLQHLAENAIADMYFPLWKAPPGFDRLRIPNAKLNNDDPAFAFYSRWCALMYRHILGQSA